MAEFDGVHGKIHYRQWTPREPRALVVFLHGLGEHVGTYEALASALHDEGIALWAADHAGHGRSEGERVMITSIDSLLEDAQTLLGLARAALPALPLVLAGHSLGSLVATLLVGERGVRPAGLVLAGSALLPETQGLAALVASGIDLSELRKDPGELTRHPGVAQQIREDPLTWQGGLKSETLAALADAAPRVSAVLSSVDVPTLFLHGAEDDLAPAAGAERAAKVLPDARVVIFPDDRHNILNELDRDDVYRVFVDFVIEHITTTQGER